MTPYKQLFLHDPDNDLIGDCHRTAIGCLLDLPPKEVPHFAVGENSIEEAKKWLESKGYCLVMFPMDLPIDQILYNQEFYNPNTYYMLTGTSPRGTAHVVICCGGAIVHDPHPEGGGLVGPCESDREVDRVYWIELLLPLNQLRTHS